MELVILALIQATIRIEMFVTLIVASLVMVVLGFFKTSPALILTGGMIFFMIALLVSTVQFGNLVSSSTVSGSTTSYTYTPDNFTLTSTVELLFVLIGALFCFFSVVVYQTKNS